MHSPIATASAAFLLQNAPAYLIVLGSAVVIFIVFCVLVDRAVTVHFKKHLRSKPPEEIEKMAFDYVLGYFKYLGEDKECVKEFKRLTDNRDLQGLIHNWKRLSRCFQNLERAAGHSGRPMILDYYCRHEIVLRELKRRRTAQSRAAGDSA